MEGVRVLEVAQFTFVPAAGAILADWGADVIKVEHPVRGDTQRGFINMGGFQLDPDRHPLIEHPNRGNAASASTCPLPVDRKCCTRSPRPPTCS
jgi:crotonobetainyl-CoA:carnitine CoA-transferase CaiB-like acyl-CoA transferase